MKNAPLKIQAFQSETKSVHLPNPKWELFCWPIWRFNLKQACTRIHDRIGFRQFSRKVVAATAANEKHSYLYSYLEFSAVVSRTSCWISLWAAVYKNALRDGHAHTQLMSTCDVTALHSLVPNPRRTFSSFFSCYRISVSTVAFLCLPNQALCTTVCVRRERICSAVHPLQMFI